MKSSLQTRLQSFIHAFRGAVTLISTQHNARIHLGAMVVVFGSGCFFRITPGEWISLVVAMVLVWMAEAFNTAIEYLADEVSLEKRERIRIAKDIAAFGVLAAAAGAAVIGFFVFVPYLLICLKDLS